ncbi:MAG: RnfABCDGE type electron transport complex subunit D, partial [Planctomycetes bacterium]|nr:RnfABCDGE type electron transport complex subunit D [Planctomycetota bacterium]
FGLRVLAIILVSYVFGGIAEVAFSIVRKEDINEGFLVTGLLFPLTLPPTTPLWIVAVGVVFGVVFGKEVFGGTGHNPFNAAIVARTFVYIGWPKYLAPPLWVIPGSGVLGRFGEYVHAGTVDALTGATALSEWSNLARLGKDVQEALRDFPIRDLFLGSVPGSCGETSALLLLAGGIFMIATRVCDWRIPLAGLATAWIAAAGFHAFDPGRFAPWPYHLFAGGLMLGILFMATDPVSGPSTSGARYAYGIWIGLFAILIRNLTPLPEGVMFAILLGNIFAPLMDEAVISLRKRKEAVLARQ